MDERKRIMSRAFSPGDAYAEISISIDDESSGAELWSELKQCVQKWNRWKEFRGGSKAGYCMELKKTNRGDD